MDLATIIGVIGGAACIMVGIIFSGGSLANVADLPSVFVTIGGSYFSLWLCAPISQCLGLMKIIGRAFKVYDFGEKQIIQNMVSLSEKARREGILALEDGLDDIEDHFMRSGLRLVVDGTDGQVIRSIMENEMNQCEGRHMGWIGLVNQWAGLAPGFGMIGTVIGLIGMLYNMGDNTAIGPNMAVALVTTLYGSLMANWILVPIGQKLISHNATEMKLKEMIIEGVLAIQAGENPRIMAQKLLTYLDPTARRAIESDVLKD